MSKLLIEKVPVTVIQQNARILHLEGGTDAILVDPGGDAEKIVSVLAEKGLKPIAIWLTHSHLDHSGGVAPLLSHFDIPFYAHPNEQFFRNSVEERAKQFNLPAGSMYDAPEPTHPIVGGEMLSLGDLDFQVLFTPGHSPGHFSFYQPESEILLAGDALFRGSIGRTDLPGSDLDTLLKSIHEKIYTLPDTTQVLSGHGPDTEIGFEKRTNPFT